MRVTFIATALGLAAAAVGGMQAVEAQPQAVKIGVIMTYSGQFADAGVQIDNGIKLYMKQHGDIVAGKRIELVRKDTGGIAPDIAKRLAQELIVRDKVDILAGFVTTPNTLAAADVSEQAKKFMVIMNAATSIITTKSRYIARVSVTLPQMHEAFGAWAYKSGIRKVYSMVVDLGPGHDAEQAFHRAFKEAGGTITHAIRFPVANPDFAAYVQRAKDVDPEAIYIWIPGGAQPAAIGKALYDRGIDPRQKTVLGNDVLADDSALRSMGDAALGLITVSYYDHNIKTSRNSGFVQAYRAEFGRNPDIFSIGGYDGMHLIYEALKKAGGKTEGDALIGAAKGMAWDSPRGPISIDPETRDIVQTAYIRRVEKVDGALVNVEFDKVEGVKDPVKGRMK
jgi:branched-chain amino acid transport system substrate-binding protein